MYQDTLKKIQNKHESTAYDADCTVVHRRVTAVMYYFMAHRESTFVHDDFKRSNSQYGVGI